MHEYQYFKIYKISIFFLNFDSLNRFLPLWFDIMKIGIYL